MPSSDTMHFMCCVKELWNRIIPRMNEWLSFLHLSPLGLCAIAGILIHVTIFIKQLLLFKQSITFLSKFK
jgi:argininosuccinate lyase